MLQHFQLEVFSNMTNDEPKVAYSKVSRKWLTLFVVFLFSCEYSLLHMKLSVLIIAGILYWDWNYNMIYVCISYTKTFPVVGPPSLQL